MFFRQLLKDETACASYLLGCKTHGTFAVVDPHADLVEDYIALAGAQGGAITAVFDTHVQADHVSGLPELVARTGATAYLPEGAGVDFAHHALRDGETVTLGNTEVVAIATPGHAPAHDAYLVTDHTRGDEPWFVLTGDALLVGDAGRPDLHAHGEHTVDEMARALYRSITQRLLTLPDHVVLYPSHYSGSVCGRGLSANPISTIGFERRNNRALQFDSEDAFAEALVRDIPPAPEGQAAIVAANRAGSPRNGVTTVRLGLRENLAQFSLLVAVNAFVGAMVGLERSTLPLIGREDFGLTSSAAVLSFIVAFGAAKALTNLAAGAWAERVGRRRLLIAGWVVALPVPLLVGVAPSWAWIVAANVLLGVNQGLAWSMTVNMKIDLVGPRRRGFALGLNEAAGYGGVAVAAALSGWLAGEFAPRDVLVAGGTAVALTGLLLSAVFVRDTARHVALEQSAQPAPDAPAPPLAETFRQASYGEPALRACSQAGLVNNLNDALAWGLVPLFLAAHGASAAEIGLVAGLYPAVWGAGQIWTGHWSDRVGRKPLIVAGMLVQAAALVLLAASGGSVGVAACSAIGLGVGTALVYPTLIAAISDAVAPVARASVVGVYRFWRDTGYVVGGLVAGLLADAVDFSATIAIVAAATAASGLWVAFDLPGRPRVAHQLA